MCVHTTWANHQPALLRLMVFMRCALPQLSLLLTYRKPVYPALTPEEHGMFAAPPGHFTSIFPRPQPRLPRSCPSKASSHQPALSLFSWNWSANADLDIRQPALQATGLLTGCAGAGK